MRVVDTGVPSIEERFAENLRGRQLAKAWSQGNVSFFVFWRRRRGPLWIVCGRARSFEYLMAARNGEVRTIHCRYRLRNLAKPLSYLTLTLTLRYMFGVFLVQHFLNANFLVQDRVKTGLFPRCRRLASAATMVCPMIRCGRCWKQSTAPPKLPSPASAILPHWFY